MEESRFQDFRLVIVSKRCDCAVSFECYLYLDLKVSHCVRAIVLAIS